MKIHRSHFDIQSTENSLFHSAQIGFLGNSVTVFVVNERYL